MQDANKKATGRESGPSDAAGFLAAAYEQLRPLAAGLMANERPGHTLTPTALVNEAAARMLERGDHAWKDRSHVIGYAATAMRHLLVDHARRRATQKRDGGGPARLDTGIALAEGRRPEPLEILALDEALTRLSALHERQGRVVELRFFGGLTVEQSAEVLGVAVPTVEADWRMARTWLHRELSR